MMRNIFKKKKNYKDIDPDEIFLDSQNLPEFNVDQFEGRIEQPISARTLSYVAVAFLLVGFVFIGKVWALQVGEGDQYAVRSENNRLKNTTLFANRGVIFDRNQVPLAWNDLSPDGGDFSLRMYATSTGLSTVLGYVKYPAKDKSGNYYSEEFIPVDGIEKLYNTALSGVNGKRLTEADSAGKVTSQSILEPPQDGQNIILSMDAGLQKEIYQSMVDFSTKAGYQGGAGVIMNINTGEMLAMANFPEYDSNVMSLGKDSEKINHYLSLKTNPFLDRVVSGLYTPGSIMKPYVAMGVLTEGVIDPNKQILSTGSISVPNPYDPSKPSIFKDWKALGYVDLRHALAMSSDVYFYEVGGGFQGQKGLGILNIKKYLQTFGFGQKTGIEITGEQSGTLPDPDWKKATFNGEDWRVGDTYNTAIGQYGVQVTPLQAVRAVASIANGGTLVKPTVLKVDDISTIKSQNVNLQSDYFKIVQEGMRLAVTGGTVKTLNVPYVEISAKSGTAELGVSKSHVNSWIMGFFPSDHPRYAFAMVMEKGVANNQIGASLVMRQVFDWMSAHRAEYLK